MFLNNQQNHLDSKHSGENDLDVSLHSDLAANLVSIASAAVDMDIGTVQPQAEPQQANQQRAVMLNSGNSNGGTNSNGTNNQHLHGNQGAINPMTHEAITQGLMSHGPLSHSVAIDPSIGLDMLRDNSPKTNADPEVKDDRLRHNNSMTDNNSVASVAASPSTPDKRKTCTFCGRTFSHPGSLGRHLDLKRGTRLHPADQVNQIRGDVKRRGDMVEIKQRRARRAKLYNARDDVKERAKTRRKMKKRADRAQAIAKTNFIQRIGMPSLPPHPSFAYVVLYFLPPTKWPHDPPTTQTFGLLERALDALEERDPLRFNDYVNKVNVAFEQWRLMNKQAKMEIWAREQRRAAEAALGTMTLYDLGTRESWLELEEQRANENMEDEEGSASEDERLAEEHSRTVGTQSQSLGIPGALGDKGDSTEAALVHIARANKMSNQVDMDIDHGLLRD